MNKQKKDFNYLKECFLYCGMALSIYNALEKNLILIIISGVFMLFYLTTVFVIKKNLISQIVELIICCFWAVTLLSLFNVITTIIIAVVCLVLIGIISIINEPYHK